MLRPQSGCPAESGANVPEGTGRKKPPPQYPARDRKVALPFLYILLFPAPLPAPARDLVWMHGWIFSLWLLILSYAVIPIRSGSDLLSRYPDLPIPTRAASLSTPQSVSR